MGQRKPSGNEQDLPEEREDPSGHCKIRTGSWTRVRECGKCNISFVFLNVYTEMKKRYK